MPGTQPHKRTLRRAGARDVALWLFGRRRRLLVSGDSMEPTLSAGDLLYIDPRAYHDQLPEVGDVVVAAHPYRNGVQLVKRVAESDAMTVELRGDNPTSSTDSRTLGPIRQRRLLGRVVSVAR